MKEYVLKDSGKREQFVTGAVRDLRENKGRFDLIPPVPLKRLALIYEKGAKKYGDNNWLNGFPFSRCLDSALRHLNSFQSGLKDEDHLAQAVFNIFAIMQYQEMIEEGILKSELEDTRIYYSNKKIPKNDESGIVINGLSEESFEKHLPGLTQKDYE